MEKTSLGFTDEKVSPLCLGTMFYGTKINPEVAFGLLDQYFESDGNFIDTANIYAWWVSDFSGGESETLIGKWLNGRKIR
jgi:aryl-alcohol dehydrogenase-like predicted oxidoreductase